MNGSPVRHHLATVWILGILVAMGFPFTLDGPSAFGQGEGGAVAITRVIVDEFPVVRVQLAAWDPSGEVAEIPKDGTRVFEDGTLYALQSVEPSDVGIRVAFVIDPGDGLFNTGVSIASVYEVAREVLHAFTFGPPWMVPTVDELLVLVQEGETSNLVVPLTSNPEVLEGGLSAYTPPLDAPSVNSPESGLFTRMALRRAMDELRYVPNGEGKSKAIVLLTPGMRADLDDISAQAVEYGIPIHVIVAREESSRYWEEALKPLAARTGGQYLGASRLRVYEPLFEVLTSHRRQHLITYRSRTASSETRRVTVELEIGGQTLSASGQYRVELSPPDVEISSPSKGEVITRLGEIGLKTAEDADPTFVTVLSQVTWPDGKPRAVGQADLLVDGVVVAQGPVVDGIAEIIWDIRSYQAYSQTPFTLQVQVVDELGLRADSAPRTVSLRYQPPAASKASELSLAYVSVGLALAALGVAGLIYFGRGRRSRGGPVVEEGKRGHVGGVAEAAEATIRAKAYLVAVGGRDGSLKRRYPISGTTSIGRSRRHADLLFDVDDESSPISRLHCTILDRGDRFTLRDDGSTNGTRLNGEILPPFEPVPLHDGDAIEVAPVEQGGLRFLFQLTDRLPSR